MGQLTNAELRDLTRATRILNRLTSAQSDALRLRARRAKGDRAFLLVAFQGTKYVTRQKVSGKNLTKEEAERQFTESLAEKGVKWDFIEATPAV